MVCSRQTTFFNPVGRQTAYERYLPSLNKKQITSRSSGDRNRTPGATDQRPGGGRAGGTPGPGPRRPWRPGSTQSRLSPGPPTGPWPPWPRHPPPVTTTGNMVTRDTSQSLLTREMLDTHRGRPGTRKQMEQRSSRLLLFCSFEAFLCALCFTLASTNQLCRSWQFTFRG